jgi:hypothetical protein
VLLAVPGGVGAAVLLKGTVTLSSALAVPGGVGVMVLGLLSDEAVVHVGMLLGLPSGRSPGNDGALDRMNHECERRSASLALSIPECMHKAEV